MPMTLIELDASSWRDRQDVWAALLPALGAPEWHGPSLDALFDSLVADLNRTKPPYRVVVVHAPAALTDYLARVRRVFEDAQAQYRVDAAFDVQAAAEKSPPTA